MSVLGALSFPALIGNIALGVTAEATLGGFPFLAYSTSCREIVIQFSRPVSNPISAGSFELTSTDFVPSFENVEIDTSGQTCVITLSENMKMGGVYSIKCLSIPCVSGGFISLDSVSFTVIAKTQAVALNAFVYGLNKICVSFDRPVGPTSNASSFTLTVGASVYNLTTVPYDPSVPDNEIILSAPAGILPSLPHTVSFAGVKDSAGNSTSGTVGLNDIFSHPAHPLLDINVLGYSTIFKVSEYENCVMVMSNLPVDGGSFTSSVTGPHHGRPGTPIATPDASNLGTLITLVTSIGNSISDHSADSVIHGGAPVYTYSDVPPTDLETCIYALTSIRRFFRVHFKDSSHSLESHFEWLTADNLPKAITLANLLKSTFNRHVSSTVSFSNKIVPGYSPSFGSFRISPLSSQRIYLTFFLSDVSPIPKQTDFLNVTLHSTTGSTTNPVENGLANPSIPNIRVQNLNGFDVFNENRPSSKTAYFNRGTEHFNLNSYIYAYDRHRTLAIHKSIDNVNTVSPSDYLSTWTDEEIASKSIAFFEKFSGHVSSQSFHYAKTVIPKKTWSEFFNLLSRHSQDALLSYDDDSTTYGQSHRVGSPQHGIIKRFSFYSESDTSVGNFHSEPPSISHVSTSIGFSQSTDSSYYPRFKVGKDVLYVFFSKPMDTGAPVTYSFSSGITGVEYRWLSDRVLTIDVQVEYEGSFTLNLTASDKEGNVVY